MSVLAVGLSHRSAPVPVLERAAVAAENLPKVLAELQDAAYVDEAFVLSTCNRVEVYAEVAKFHGGVAELSNVLSQTSGVPLDALTPHLYVHYEDRAIQHLFTVAAGLDSMVVGETQILGQVRTAYRVAREEAGVGRVLGPVVQHALRVGKRVHTDTAIDRAGASVVRAGLELVAAELGSLAGRRALVVGAGSMGALVVSLLREAGAGAVVVANRTRRHAQRLAEQSGVRVVELSAVEPELETADVLVCSTAATGIVVPADVVERAMSVRPRRKLAVVDLAMPHDVDPAVRELAGVTLIDLDSLRTALAGAAAGAEIEAARRIVTDEVAAFLTWQRAGRVAPTVIALRSMAADVVRAELARLDARLPDLESRARAEIETAVRRVVDKLLHAPTVRVKELAEGPDGDAYAAALRELFDLDPAAPAAVTAADVRVEDELL